MPNRNYERGRRLEYEVTQTLLEEGFDFAQRMAGSHSPFDVVGLNYKTKQIVFVQCKTKVGEKVGYEDSEKIEDDGWKMVRVKRTKFIKRRNT